MNAPNGNVAAGMWFGVPGHKNFNPKIRQHVAAWVRYKMRVRSLNPTAMAQLMGVAAPTVNRIRNERRTAGLDFAVAFSEKFNVPLENLIYTMPPKAVITGEEAEPNTG